MSTEDEVLAILQEHGAERRELGVALRRELDGDPAALRAEVDPLDAKLLGERGLRLDTLEALARDYPGKAYVSLPGDWGRVLFVVSERGKFIGYEYGGAELWTLPGDELDYFMAGPLGVQRLSRDGALALLEAALEKEGTA